MGLMGWWGVRIVPLGKCIRPVIAAALPAHGGAVVTGSEVEVWEAAGGEGGIEFSGGLGAGADEFWGGMRGVGELGPC